MDATYKTIAHRSNRIVGGFSMGGYGACEFAVKFPDSFSICLNFDGALHNESTLKTKHPDIWSEIFNNNSDYYKNYCPYENAVKNQDNVRGRVAFYFAVGSLNEYNRRYRDHLRDNAGMTIPEEYYIETNQPHHFESMMSNVLGTAPFAFIQQHLVDPVEIAGPARGPSSPPATRAAVRGETRAAVFGLDGRLQAGGNAGSGHRSAGVTIKVSQGNNGAHVKKELRGR